MNTNQNSYEQGNSNGPNDVSSSNSRRNFFKKLLGSGVALGGIGTVLLETRRLFGQAGGSDVDVLNAALTLEHLEAAFYRDQLARFTPRQFRRRFGNLDSTFRGFQTRNGREIINNQNPIPRGSRPISPAGGNVGSPTNNLIGNISPTNNLGGIVGSPTNNVGGNAVSPTNNLIGNAGNIFTNGLIGGSGFVGGNGLTGGTGIGAGSSISNLADVGSFTNVGGNFGGFGGAVGSPISPNSPIAPISPISPISPIAPIAPISPVSPIGGVFPGNGGTVGGSTNSNSTGNTNNAGSNGGGSTNGGGSGSANGSTNGGGTTNGGGSTNNVGNTNGTGNVAGSIGPQSVHDFFTELRDQEAAHVQSLTETIAALGGTPVRELQYNFGVDSLPEFILLAQTFENLGVSAYDELLGMISAPELRVHAATIATVEARHAAFLNLVQGTHPFPEAFDTPRTTAEVMALLAPFVVG